MNTRNQILISLNLSLCASLFTQAASALEVIELTDSLAIIEENSYNIVVSHGSDGILLIDNGHAELSKQVLNAAKKLSSQSERLLVIKTHSHKPEPYTSALSENALILTDNGTFQYLNEKSSGNSRQPKSTDGQPPYISFDFNLNINFNGDSITIKTVKGAHTEYDSIVYFSESGHLYLGNLYQVESAPVIDIERGGNAFMHMRVMEEIRAFLPPGKAVDIIPGQGPVASRDQFLDYKEKVESSFAYVATAKSKGQDKKQINKEIKSLKLGTWTKHKARLAEWISAIYGKSAGK